MTRTSTILGLVFGVVAGFSVAALASRSSGGTYSLPVGNPVVSGTTITAAWANNTLNDIKTEITDSLSRSGKGGMLVALACYDGNYLAPGISFANEPGLGWYRNASHDVRLAINGADIQKWGATTSTVVTDLAVLGSETVGGALMSGSLSVSRTLAVSGSVGPLTMTGANTLTCATSSPCETISAASGTALWVSASGTASGPVLRVTGGAATGEAALFEDGQSSGYAIVATAASTFTADATYGAGNTTAIVAYGAKHGAGIAATGGTTGGGIGVVGTGGVTGQGGQFNSDNATNPTEAPINIGPVVNTPTSLTDGDLWATTAGALNARLNGATKQLWPLLSGTSTFTGALSAVGGLTIGATSTASAISWSARAETIWSHGTVTGGTCTSTTISIPGAISSHADCILTLHFTVLLPSTGSTPNWTCIPDGINEVVVNLCNSGSLSYASNSATLIDVRVFNP